MLVFQAEDGMRDIGVTGVQTCALPICVDARLGLANRQRQRLLAVNVLLGLRRLDERDRVPEIGRASCRERVQISVVAVSLKKTMLLPQVSSILTRTVLTSLLLCALALP